VFAVETHIPVFPDMGPGLDKGVEEVTANVLAGLVPQEFDAVTDTVKLPADAAGVIVAVLAEVAVTLA
jgi:hypothetical protein